MGRWRACRWGRRWNRLLSTGIGNDQSKTGPPLSQFSHSVHRGPLVRIGFAHFMADFSYTSLSRLIIVPATIYGPLGSRTVSFILDTGASMTLVSPVITDSLGYGAHDGLGFSNVQSPIGQETGYRLVVQSFSALGKRLENFELACHDLGEHIHGLVGMNFLEEFDFCIYPKQKLIRI